MIFFPSPLFGSSSDAAGASDPNWGSVVLLAQFDEANGVTTFTDKTGRHTLTGSGSPNAAGDTTTPPSFQSTSVHLSGSAIISIADSADWNFGSGDFTVEYFSNHGSTSNQAILAQYSSSTDKAWSIFESTALTFFYSTDGTTDLSVPASGISPSNGSWTHKAVSRVGNTLYVCHNGVIVASGSFSGVTLRDSARPLVVGGNNNGTTALYGGHIAALRITKGVGRYSGSVSSSYTVPSQPYPSH